MFLFQPLLFKVLNCFQSQQKLQQENYLSVREITLSILKKKLKLSFMSLKLKEAPKVVRPISFHGNYLRYGEYDNNVR